MNPVAVRTNLVPCTTGIGKRQGPKDGSHITPIEGDAIPGNTHGYRKQNNQSKKKIREIKYAKGKSMQSHFVFFFPF